MSDDLIRQLQGMGAETRAGIPSLSPSPGMIGRIRRRRAAVAVSSVALSVLVVLGGVAGAAALLGRPGPEAEGTIADAVAATQAQGTARVYVAMKFAGGFVPESFTTRQLGLADFTTGDSTLQLLGDDPLSRAIAEMRFVDGSGYFRRRGDYRRPWVRASHEQNMDTGELSFGGLPTGDDWFEPLRSAAEVDHVGTETVRDVTTEHYRAEIDPHDFLGDAPASEFADEVSMTFEVWIDPDDLVRRMRMVSRTRGPYEFEMTATIEFFDFGMAVDIRPPPESEIDGEADIPSLLSPVVDEKTENGVDDDLFLEFGDGSESPGFFTYVGGFLACIVTDWPQWEEAHVHHVSGDAPLLVITREDDASRFLGEGNTEMKCVTSVPDDLIGDLRENITHYRVELHSGDRQIIHPLKKVPLGKRSNAGRDAVVEEPSGRD